MGVISPVVRGVVRPVVRGVVRGGALSALAADYLNRLGDNRLGGAYDAALARLIDRLAGGIGIPESAAYVPMAGFAFPGTGEGALEGLLPTHDKGTIFAAVSGDWNAKTGLKGDGSSIYVNSNRNNNADGQDDQSMGAYLTEGMGTVDGTQAVMGAGSSEDGASEIRAVYTQESGGERLFLRSQRNTVSATSWQLTPRTGFLAISRVEATNFVLREQGSNQGFIRDSQTPYNGTIGVFARETNEAFGQMGLMRSPFYFIGPGLSEADLAELDAATTEFATALAAI